MAKGKRKIDREHEIQLAVLKAFAADPELKYFIGAGLGAGIGALGVAMGQVANQSTPAEPDKKWEWHPSNLQIGAATWLMGPVNPALIQGMVDKYNASKATDATNAAAGGLGIIPMGEIMFTIGTGFSGACLGILILKAMFGTGGLGEVLKGIGEIVPL